ncbi:hypothetical protein DPMN_112414 [Dreissena polymorpha]|uniref:Uncharacterized protein n=1 Tax=Dreissena polymorpha TaxID=45954 RepID=A0A9D4QPQ6_DREPO|nr:hypothetical protein DPMN_112357 [Dreissena polymorpha]KAH3838996.1 hypothetical protein DPMN_112414 [Dreissena polymorpha]
MLSFDEVYLSIKSAPVNCMFGAGLVFPAKVELNLVKAIPVRKWTGSNIHTYAVSVHQER